MALAHLVIPNEQRSAIVVVAAGVPRVPVADMFRAGDQLGLEVSVLRTLARLGDDRVVLCELSDRSVPLPDGSVWADIASVTGASVEVRSAITDWVDGPEPTALQPWEREGWFSAAMEWVDQVIADRGLRRAGFPVQLRHWGLSAVFRVPTNRGDMVVKEVPDVLGREGALTAWLADVAPSKVPEVLAIAPHANRFAMEFVDGALPVEPDGVLALVEIQNSCTGRADALRAIGLRDLRPDAVLEAATELSMRDDLLLARDWSLASTDSRVPPRPMTPDDLVAMRHLITRLEQPAKRLGDHLPDGTVVHGDFHVHNVLRTPERTVVIDWGQAAIGHPVFDLPAWSMWATRPDDAIDLLLRAWEFDRDGWRDVRPLAYLFHAVIAGILADGMPDHSRQRDWAAGAQKLVLDALRG